MTWEGTFMAKSTLLSNRLQSLLNYEAGSEFEVRWKRHSRLQLRSYLLHFVQWLWDYFFQMIADLRQKFIHNLLLSLFSCRLLWCLQCHDKDRYHSCNCARSVLKKIHIEAIMVVHCRRWCFIPWFLVVWSLHLLLISPLLLLWESAHSHQLNCFLCLCSLMLLCPGFKALQTHLPAVISKLSAPKRRPLPLPSPKSVYWLSGSEMKRKHVWWMLLAIGLVTFGSAGSDRSPSRPKSQFLGKLRASRQISVRFYWATGQSALEILRSAILSSALFRVWQLTEHVWRQPFLWAVPAMAWPG